MSIRLRFGEAYLETNCCTAVLRILSINNGRGNNRLCEVFPAAKIQWLVEAEYSSRLRVSWLWEGGSFPLTRWLQDFTPCFSH